MANDTRERRVLSTGEWAAWCAAFAAAPPARADDTGVQDADPGRDISPDEYQALVARNRREHQRRTRSASSP